jgi:BRCA1-A complex subunit BRE
MFLLLCSGVDVSVTLQCGVDVSAFANCFTLCLSFQNAEDPEAVFYIPLKPDQLGLSHLSESYAKDEIALIIKLSPPNASQAKTTVLVSPQLDKALGNLSKISIPNWGTDCSPCLMDYVPLVHSALKDKVKSITRMNEVKKEFIFMWLSAYEGAVLEYDTEKYTFISFLFEVKGFSIIVYFSITKAFPIEPPVIKLRSVYHKLDGYPYEVVSKNYEFSSQWSAEEMMEKTKKHLLELIPKFKEMSVKNGELLT